ncbi:MAG: acyl carrier protein [Rhodospirillaceae bacterium]|nr:acyl carrier protein [Rhodospirillaceae bacterium]
MTADDIRQILLEEIGNIAPEADLGALDPEVDYREKLDIDSIGFLNLIIAIGKRLKIEVPEKDYARLGTLSGAVSYLVARKRG